MSPEIEEENELVRQIRAGFRTDAERTDRCLMERGCTGSDLEANPYTWIEAFADRTTDAVRERNSDVVERHTGFMAEQYQSGSSHIRQLIDVAYAENLMWNVEDHDKVWAWPYISPMIRQLYVEMWGSPCPKG
ncbi:hypothetical protein [Lysobacter sp. Hz 25]|uniref:DUF7674 family protein n=1 Tax=Lysobacter sp. Hz 25 TaxID=3383698 RepID=UPI0038D3D4D3